MSKKPLTQTGIDMLSFSLTGNVTPPQWYKSITHENGKPDAIAVTLLSEIVYWYRPTEERNEPTGGVTGHHRKFDADKLQRSYTSFADEFGFTKNQVKAAIKNLQDKGVIDLEFRTIKPHGQAINNVLYIGLNVARLKELTYPSEIINTPLCNSNGTGMPLELGTYTEINAEITPKNKENTFADVPSAHTPAPSDLEHETPAQEGSLPPESVEQDYPPVAISVDCQAEIATLFDDPPAPAAPAAPPKPAGPNKNAIRAQLEAHFCAKTKLPPPHSKTAREKKAAGSLWWSPLREIAELCEWDAARAEKLICLTVDHLRSGKMTIANPNSILKTATAIYTGNVPGVKMPHEKKLQKITLIHSDGTLEEVEEYV
ncbi:MAG: hypothetical protein WC359_13320 [Dehalococcoidia bacterium]|jgi:hypothetical protein